MSPMKLFSYLNNQLDYYMTGKKVTGQLSASQWHEKQSHFHLHPKQALFLDFSIVSMGARDLVSNPFPVYYLCSNPGADNFFFFFSRSNHTYQVEKQFK